MKIKEIKNKENTEFWYNLQQLIDCGVPVCSEIVSMDRDMIDTIKDRELGGSGIYKFTHYHDQSGAVEVEKATAAELELDYPYEPDEDDEEYDQWLCSDAPSVSYLHIYA